MTTLAIDFGTSNTVVCAYENQRPTVIDLGGLTHRYDGSPPLIPSVLFVGQNQQFLIGAPARNKRDPSRLFKGFKRDLSQQFQPAPRYVDGRAYTPQETAQIFLRQVLVKLREMGWHPTKLILTVPVGSYEAYLHTLQDLASSLGVEQVTFVDESTAAALGYGIEEPGSLILVIDLGGGTLDLSLVRILKPEQEASFYKAEVIYKTDRAYGCGGVDIDTWIAERMLQELNLDRKKVPASSFQVLCEIAERLKIRLSSHPQASEAWLDEESFETYTLTLHREQLQELLEERGFLPRLREAIDEVIEEAYYKGISKKDLHRVLLVGGTSLIPAVQNQVISLFGRDKVSYHKPFEAVAEGALALTRFAHLQDHLRHTYVLRTWNPYLQTPDFFTLFKSGTTYPATLELPPLQANRNGQSQIHLAIGEIAEEGETEVIDTGDGRLLVRKTTPDSSFRALGRHQLSIPLQPPGKVGVDRLQVTLTIDAGRVLRATVVDLETGRTLLQQQVVARLG
jgi:molecular chaperone DnaK (HSP70)